MRVSCLCPTFNRFPQEGHLVNEAVESFLRQDHADCELIICNDTPGQTLVSPDPRVRVFNLPERLPTQSDKIEFMLGVATGELFCRWDDDDISLPWRLSLSEAKLGDRLEWRPENYWYVPKGGRMAEVRSPGNTHIMAIWRRETLERIGGYPAKRAGGEDQEFNQASHRPDVLSLSLGRQRESLERQSQLVERRSVRRSLARTGTAADRGKRIQNQAAVAIGLSEADADFCVSPAVLRPKARDK
jgi:hypothetical protein